MAFTRAEKLHLFIAKLSALPHPCVKRSFSFIATFPSHTKGGSESRPASAFFFLPIWQKSTIHDYSCRCAGRAYFSCFLPLYSLRHLNELKIWKYATLRPVSLRGCWHALRASPHMWTDCMRETAVRNPESDWTARMSACVLTSHRVPCQPSAIPDGWRSPASSGSSIISSGTWRRRWEKEGRTETFKWKALSTRRTNVSEGSLACWTI